MKADFNKAIIIFNNIKRKYNDAFLKETILLILNECHLPSNENFLNLLTESQILKKVSTDMYAFTNSDIFYIEHLKAIYAKYQDLYKPTKIYQDYSKDSYSALIQFSIDFLEENGYKIIKPSK